MKIGLHLSHPFTPRTGKLHMDGISELKQGIRANIFVLRMRCSFSIVRWSMTAFKVCPVYSWNTISGPGNVPMLENPQNFQLLYIHHLQKFWLSTVQSFDRCNRTGSPMHPDIFVVGQISSLLTVSHYLLLIMCELCSNISQFLRLFCRMRSRSLVSEREFTRLVGRSVTPSFLGS